MTIAILGGCFDPPHWGHWWMAQQVLEKRKEIAQVWLVPAAKHQWKPIIAKSYDRLKMLSFFVSKKIHLSNLEIKRGGISYSIDTVKEIKKRFDYKLYWLVGSDIVDEFPRWAKAKDLPKLATFLVFPRGPYEIPKILPPGFEIVSSKDLIVTNLSSTIIRQRLKQGKSIHGFVPEGVERYIKEHGLYC